MKRLFVAITILSCLIGKPAKADNAWDHLGTAYAIQMVSYGITEKLGIGTHRECMHINHGEYRDYLGECEFGVVRYHRTEAIIFSAALTLIGTFAYSYLKQMNGSPMPWNEIGYNAIGQAAAIGTVYMFKF